MACAPLPCLFPVSRVQWLRSLGRLGLVALFFFPGVGVVDDEVGQGELAGGLGGGDQAVNGLRLPGEGIGGCSTPRGGQRDLAILMGVGAIEHRAPSLGRGVVVADEAWVVVGVDAFLPCQSRRCCDRVGGSVSPIPFVFHRCERHRDFAAKQRDRMGLGGVGDVDDGGDVLVRVGDPGGKFVDASPIGSNSRSGATQNRPC